MKSKWKVPVYVFLFGLLTLYAAIFTSQPKKNFNQEEVLGRATNLSMFVEPEDGREPLTTVLRGSEKEILLEVYLLSDPEIITVLKELDLAGREVRVILEEHPFGGGGLNPKTKADLESAGVEVKWGNRVFPYTHQKSVVVDDKITCILNLNITKTAFSKNREYNICSTNSDEIAEVRQIFLADWERREYLPQVESLVVAPTSARGKLLAFLRGAKKEVKIETEILGDEEVVAILTELGKRLPVRVILPEFKRVEANREAAEKLQAAGVSVRTLASPYVHAKTIIVDSERAYVGSVNLSAQSMDLNRELGILVAQGDIIARVQQVFEEDWQIGEEVRHER